MSSNPEFVKGLQVNTLGNPNEVVTLVEIDIPEIGTDDVLVDLIASPINPSNILQIQGLYPGKPKLPSIFGSEGVGRVVKTGVNVSNVKINDIILLPFGRGTWQEKHVLNADKLFPLPFADSLQLAMVGINPPTAFAMLNNFTQLKEGDWVVQNAANSAVGRYVIILAQELGIKTINIVRRESLVPELSKLGADMVLVDGPDLVNQIKENKGDGKIKLGLDAIAGKATNTLASVIDKKGKIVVYGALSLDLIQVNMALMMAKDISLHTFWLVHWLNETSPKIVQSTYSKLITMIASKKLIAKVDRTYPLTEYRDAFKLAMQEGRDGKVLFTGPGFNKN